MIVRERGYVIFGSDQDLLPGDIFKNFLSPDGVVWHPFRVVRETDRADYVAQIKTLGRELDMSNPWPRYYVVETD